MKLRGNPIGSEHEILLKTTNSERVGIDTNFMKTTINRFRIITMKEYNEELSEFRYVSKLCVI